MSSFDPFKINNPALDAIRSLQENSALAAIRELQASSAFSAALKLETTGAFAAVRELQSTLAAVKSSMGGATAALEEYRKIVAPISESVKAMNAAYAPIFEQTRVFDSLNIKGIVAGLQTSSAAMSAISGLNLSGIASIIDALPKYDFLSDIVSDDFTIADAEELYESGKITQDDINEEISEIVSKKQFSPKAEWDKFKKSKWFIAIKILIILVTFVCNPVTEYATDKALDKLGINEFWENSGIYDLIDSIFGDSEDSAVSETEAKETVDKTKTGNVSKQRREDLLAKIKDIRTFISAAPQDENTGNLLVYLSELEKDVCGKKYGLVFEEHREDIDEVLATHTPVLTEQSDLFIDNGGEMNFLIEGDNLASLQLLEKTHKGKIDVIYIDPPYNTGNKDFVYDDAYIDNNDLFSHSKWLSFMRKRLKIAKKLLADDGVIFISIDDNEYAELKILCDEIFAPHNFLTTFHMQVRYPDKSISTEEKAFKPLMEYVLMYSKNLYLFQPHQETTDYGLEKFCYQITETANGTHFTVGNQEVVVFKPNEWKIEKVEGNLNGLKETWVTGSIYTTMSYGKVFQAVVEPRVSTDGLGCLYKVLGRGDDGLGYRYYTGPQKATATKGKMYSGIPLEKAEQFRNGKAPQKKIPIVNCYDFSADFGNIRSEGGVGFNSGKKPVKMLKQLINYHASKNATILDFFAGSASTGHAVLALNKDDDGHRTFIVCTNNENNICRTVTYPRLSNVFNGYGKSEGYAASLKYYKVDFIPVSERMYYEYADELLMHIRELVELENGVNFTDNAEIGIVLTEEELDEFIANTDAFAKCRKLYMGHDLLPSDEQEQILRMHGVEISIIPDYYYRDLQEG